MNRVIKYIETIIVTEIYKKGYVYLSDDVLFVKEKVSEELRKRGLDDITQFSRLIRLEKLKMISNNEYQVEDETFNLNVLVEYQSFLDENKLTKNSRKKIRELLTEQINQSSTKIKIERNEYLFDPSKIKLHFIDSISDIIRHIDTKSDVIKKNLYFRGHANLNWELIPSVYRGNWIENEHNMFREILIRNPNDFYETKSTFEKLTIMQHYGLPTRLLDITKNPLVAMYFACSDISQNDFPGEIFFFVPHDKTEKYYDSDTVSVISNIAKADREFNVSGDREKFNKENVKFIHLIKEEKPYFLENINPDDFNKTLIVKPINNNQRIKRQQGHFFLFGINGTINNPAKIDFSYKENDIHIKFLIEPLRKKELMNELEAVGISKDTLFPEIDNGTDYIKSKY